MLLRAQREPGLVHVVIVECLHDQTQRLWAVGLLIDRDPLHVVEFILVGLRQNAVWKECRLTEQAPEAKERNKTAMFHRIFEVELKKARGSWRALVLVDPPDSAVCQDAPIGDFGCQQVAPNLLLRSLFSLLCNRLSCVPLAGRSWGGDVQLLRGFLCFYDGVVRG